LATLETLGVGALGTQPVGSGILHDFPSVTVTPLGTVSSGGPTLTVDWSYSQPQGDPQDQYRVQILSDDLLTVHYDSGWLTGEVESHVLDVDAQGVPHDSSDVTVKVEVTAVRGPAEDIDPFIIQWGTPHCTISAPADESIWSDIEGVDVSWAFSDDDGGNTQSHYRVRLKVTGSGLVVHNTGWVASTATSYRIPFNLNPGTEYTVEVQLKNNHGIRTN
jgi:hypothetical protein